MNEGTDIGELLRGRLASARQVSSLVADRITPDVLPSGCELPAIRYEVVATDPTHHLGGASGFAFSRVQFDCYGRSRRQANGVASAVIDALDGFQGPLGYDDATPDAGCRVHDCTLDNAYDRRDAPAPGSEQFRYRRTLDFQVSHTTPVPSLTPL